MGKKDVIFILSYPRLEKYEIAKVAATTAEGDTPVRFS